MKERRLERGERYRHRASGHLQSFAQSIFVLERSQEFVVRFKLFLSWDSHQILILRRGRERERERERERGRKMTEQ